MKNLPVQRFKLSCLDLLALGVTNLAIICRINYLDWNWKLLPCVDPYKVVYGNKIQPRLVLNQSVSLKLLLDKQAHTWEPHTTMDCMIALHLAAQVGFLAFPRNFLSKNSSLDVAEIYWQHFTAYSVDSGEA